jgi:hypothetical protein
MAASGPIVLKNSIAAVSRRLFGLQSRAFESELRTT